MMKKLMLFLLVFVSVSSFAQVKESAGNAVQNKKLFVVNGVIFNKDIAIIPKDSIVFVDSLLKDANKDFPMQHDVIVLVTKDFATKKYQEKFSKFSKKYHSYLIAHKGDDSRIGYVLPDGSVLTGNSIDKHRKLYKIAASDIKSITFDKESEKATGIKPAIVGINIKAKNN